MKLKSVLELVTLSVALTARVACAQSYNIPWFTVDSGGGTSAGGAYALSGSIGQPDAGQMSGGNFTVEGGFWAIAPTAPTPASPTLRIQLTVTNTVLIAWPDSATGFSLQQSPLLGPANWQAVTNAPVQVGSERQVILSPTVGTAFYRLKYAR